jgi:hypothetical protein
VEIVSFPSFSDWSSSDDDPDRNLEDDEDTATETPEDSPCLECWEEAEHKTEEEEDEMLKEQDVPLESFATARMEESPIMLFGCACNLLLESNGSTQVQIMLGSRTMELNVFVEF